MCLFGGLGFRVFRVCLVASGRNLYNDYCVLHFTFAIMLDLKKTMQIILLIGIAGMMFSGYLSYDELFTESCELGCSTAGDEGKLLGIPVCVYGFSMYTIVTVLATQALFLGKKTKEDN